MRPGEVPLEALASRYADDSDEEGVAPVRQQPPQEAPAAGDTAATAAAAAPAASDAAAQPEQAAGGSGEEWSEEDDEEDDWDSDDDDLASALEWADLREVHEARGHAASGGLALGSHRPNAHGGALNRGPAKVLPTAGNMGRLDARFSSGAVQLRDDLIDSLGGLSNAAMSAVKVAHGSKAAAAANRSKDRADRATVEQVLDPRTRMVLFKMLNRGVFSEINGVVSTGKEANVYHASAGPSGGCEMAIKVYKTAILVFRDRDRYVVGDSRFQRYCKSNPRKMVKMWAEKEMRNLARLNSAGIPSPKPVQLRMHVLVMEFLGENGVAAPRLKDAGLPPPRMRQAYTEMLIMLRTLYQKCRLVHADLSEYNVLVHNNELYCIDVSQAVELDHPRAFDFLREDCQHVNDFFRRAGVATLSVRELFDFTVDPSFGTEGPALEAELDRLMEVAVSRPAATAEQEVADAVFAKAYIPKKLEDVMNYERDHARLTSGTDTEGIYYQALAGMKADMSGARVQQEVSSGKKKGGNAGSKAAVQQQQAQQQAAEQQQAAAPLAPLTPADPSQQGTAPAAAAAATAEQSSAVQQGAAPPPAGEQQQQEASAPGSPVDAERAAEPAAAAAAAAAAAEAGSSTKKKKSVRFADEASGSDSDGSGSGSEGEWEDRPKMTREEVKEMRKAHKKEVKESNAERRKQKMPKAAKKRAVAKSNKGKK
ncbi:serine threonine-kinase RIO1-like [Micractinium conductrix]|uniref:Serine/threonine-protein kinase RIO1 n=1 Tax=Micractinium conductrix TaxID=554055 RepID=A0A2P6VME0_9CHLO|nr:serine threonine-kinase RIO1-like [Micractinium conductrix]|eukprot:PSC75250.1 serine threonine-kinase RIO1-like [Micractinium conductrix]